MATIYGAEIGIKTADLAGALLLTQLWLRRSLSALAAG
jgi:hypothetical protein